MFFLWSLQCGPKLHSYLTCGARNACIFTHLHFDVEQASFSSPQSFWLPRNRAKTFEKALLYYRWDNDGKLSNVQTNKKWWRRKLWIDINFLATTLCDSFSWKDIKLFKLHSYYLYCYYSTQSTALSWFILFSLNLTAKMFWLIS